MFTVLTSALGTSVNVLLKKSNFDVQLGKDSRSISSLFQLSSCSSLGNSKSGLHVGHAGCGLALITAALGS